MADFKYLNDNRVADRAIIIMAILRKFKLPGSKGVGANRDDHPLFGQIVGHMVANDDPKIYKEELFQARTRVAKYARQLEASEYNPYLTPDSEIQDLLDIHENITTVKGISIRAANLSEEYGEW